MVVTSCPSACTANMVHDFTLTPVEMHGACAAITGVATYHRPRFSEGFSQVLHKQHPRFDIIRVGHPVDFTVIVVRAMAILRSLTSLCLLCIHHRVLLTI